MSLREWKKLAESETKAGKMKNQLYNQITAERVKSKTSDAAITKSFRLDEIIEGLKGKPVAPRVRKRGPGVPPAEEEGIDYAPEVDPYEDMDVQGLLNLEDYVPSQGEKQIAPKPPEYQGYPEYQMDPSYWELDPEEPRAYEDLSMAEDKKAIEAPPDDDDDDDDEGEEDIGDANKILDHLELPNYDDVQMRLDESETTATKQRNYLDEVVKDAERRRRQVIAFKSGATKKFKKGLITAVEKDRIHKNSDKFRSELNGYINTYRFKSKSIKGYGTKRQLGRGVNGAGVFFYNDAKELLQKLTLIIGEMEAGNTSIQMRNTGQSILDALLRSKSINKSQYQKLVKNYFWAR